MTPPLSRRTFLAQSASALTLALSPSLLAELTGKTEQKPLGVAIVGLGYYSTYELAPALKETNLCRLTAVVTGDRDKGRTWASRHHFPDTSIYNYDSMHELAGNADVDIVYVVTPPGLHRLHVERAVAAGKHVVCEKPMAPTTADCDAMIAACKTAGRQLSIGYRLHYDLYHQELQRLASAKTFGAFKTIRGGHGFRIDKYNWRINRALAGGGPLPDVGIYSLHAACMAANAEPVAVTAKEGAKSRPDFFKEVEESIDWTMEFADGARAECRTTYNDNVNYFRAEGDSGWLELEPAYYYRGIRGRTSQGALSFPEVRQQARHLDAIAAALIANQPVPTPGELGRRDVRIMEAIYEAARTQAKVTL